MMPYAANLLAINLGNFLRGFAVAAWGDTHGGMKRASEGAMVVEAAFVGDIRDSLVGFPQETRGGGQASLADELAGG